MANNFVGIFQGFQALGINIIINYVLDILKASIMDSHVLLESFMAVKTKEIQELIETIIQLSHKYISFHILQ